MLVLLTFAIIVRSFLPMKWQLYGVVAASIAICFGLYWMLGRRKRIANRIKELYGITMDKFEELSDEERKQLKRKPRE